MKVNVRIVLAIAVFLGLVGGIYSFFEFTKGASITVTTASGADIYITGDSEGEYKKVGTSSATFKFKEIPARIYIKVQQGDKESLSGLYVTDDSSKTIDIPLSETNPGSTAYDGAVSHPFLSGDVAYGIEPSSHEIVRFGTKEFLPPRRGFIGIPFLKSIGWINEDTFVYNSFSEGPGAFVNGEDTSDGFFAQTITDTSGKRLQETARNISQRVEDIAVSGKTTYYITNIGLYRSDNYGAALVKIADFTSDSLQSMSATNNRVVRLEAEVPATYASELNTSSTDTEITHSQVKFYTSEGEETYMLEVFGDAMAGATDVRDRIMVATNEEIACTNQSVSTLTPISAPIADAVVYKGNSYVLAGSALWRVADDCLSLQKVVGFNEENIGLKDSLVLHNDSLLFGIQPLPGSSFSPYTARFTAK